ncbi:MAG TPA: diaminopimelate epimerase, partial [Thermodesulfobacteriota bacterium]|nr:diaminopimelate epimerase [Thermodesulfobacteriota bacterium]
GKRQAFDFINTGVPHTVIWVEDNSQVEVNRLGRLIRFHDQFEPAGTNVNFVQPLPNGGLYVRTYERGVEGETLACGTGAVAAACVAFLKGKTVSPVRIKTSGGEILSVHLEGEPGEKIDKAYLEGMVRLVFQGEIFAEALAE